MPNLLLTNFCNRNCPYCFALAQVETGTTQPDWEMSRDELDCVLGYLDPRWDIVSLLGGEPTLHSRFAEVVGEIAGRGYRIKIFTNGTTPRLRDIQGINPEELNIILNLNAPDTYSPGEWFQIESNCRHFGPRLSLSFNIYSPDFSWEYLKRAITDWGLDRLVRVGIAQPIRGMSNAYLLEEDLRPASMRLVDMAQDLALDGINIGFDCGFRSCLFTLEERGVLAECGARFLYACRPILDIGPDLIVWRCFPFSVEQGVKLTDFKSLAEVVDHFEQKWSDISGQGNTARCAWCDNFISQACRGGCLSRTITDFAAEGPHA